MRALSRARKIFSIVICLVLLTSLAMTQIFAADISNKAVKGTWQGIIDGKSGEGSFFYRMEFKEDGTVFITKQSGEHNISEYKTWKLDEKSIEIQSKSDALITDFDGASLILTSEKSISYSKDAYSGKISRHNSAIALIHWFLILIVLIGLNELFRKSKWAGIIFYFALPVALLPIWSSYGITYWFKWVKLYSVVGACIWFTFIRYSKLGNYNFAKLIAALFLAVNIAEAVTQDFSMGYLPNILNAIAGILSILTLFYGWKGIHADNSKEKDMVWPKMTVSWIIAYDIWNWVFVYLNFPGSASGHIMVLLSCTLPSLFIKKGTWLQARAFTLAAWFIYYFTFPQQTESLQLLIPRNSTLMLFAAILSILANGLYALVYINMLSRKKGATLQG